jgi:hypothetical protein
MCIDIRTAARWRPPIGKGFVGPSYRIRLMS